MRYGLIDGDVILYRHCAASEQEIHWGGDFWTLHSDVSEVKGLISESIEDLSELLGLDSVVVAFSDPDRNWRKEILPSYKENRKGKRKPLAYWDTKAWMVEVFETFERPSLEADDVLGILSTSPKILPDAAEKIIISVDKDFKTIPGYFFNVNKPDVEPVFITEAEADYQHLYQTLAGDMTDGYKGCPGVGPKTAVKILESAEVGCWWDAVLEAFKKAGLTEEDALVQARVARICRASDYDFKKKEIIPWKPN